MMRDREYKFRAWDHDKSDMIDWEHLMGYCDLDYLFGNIGLDPKRDTVPDLDVMEWVGIKDKNGVDIYEGDYLLKDGKTEPGLVEYFELCANYTLDGCLLAVSSGQATDYFEGSVVGNLYENPELRKYSGI